MDLQLEGSGEREQRAFPAREPTVTAWLVRNGSVDAVGRRQVLLPS
jgi:hypothetical protein